MSRRRQLLEVVVVILSTGVVAAPTGSAQLANGAVSPGVPLTAASYPPLTPRLIGAVNEQQARAHTYVVILSASVSAQQMPAVRSAAREIMSDCGLGSGGWVVAAGYVTGSLSTKPMIAVFLNPAGSHGGVHAGGVQPSPIQSNPPPLNWYVGFPVASAPSPEGVWIPAHDVCYSGYSPRLPPLPTHPGNGFS